MANITTLINLSRRTIKTAAALSVTTLAATAALSAAETGKPAAAINAISHVVYGDKRNFGSAVTVDETVVGAVANTAAMVFWAALWERFGARDTVRESVLPAIAAASIAAVVNYVVVPKQYTPGFEKKLSTGAIAAIYAVFAVTLLASPLWNTPSRCAKHPS